MSLRTSQDSDDPKAFRMFMQMQVLKMLKEEIFNFNQSQKRALHSCFKFQSFFNSSSNSSILRVASFMVHEKLLSIMANDRFLPLSVFK